MKILLASLVLVLLISVPLMAQKPIQDLPELQEWFSISLSGEGSGISYLPGFSSNGGMNAIAIRADGDPTWYLRYAYDTVNQFSWSYGGTYMIAQADLNGDRINDYVDSRGFVYKGIIKNQPPEKIPVAQPLEHLNMRVTVTGDFNGDGYEDIITSAKSGIEDSGKDILLLLLGNKDITKLKVLSIVDQPYNKDYIIGAYMTAEKQPRLVTYRLSDQKSFEGFVLQSMDFTGGDIKVSVTTLDSVGHYLKPNEKPVYQENASALYHSKEDYQTTLLATHGALSIYSIEQDKFLYKYDNSRTTANVFPFITGIDVSNKQAWGRKSWDLLFYSGNPATDTVPKAKFGLFYNNKAAYADKMVGIGDVTGDKIGDVALYYADYTGSGPGYFVIAKGISPTSVAETNNSNITLRSTEPNPIGITRTAILQITIEQTGNYILTLYDGNGKSIGEIFKGELPVGELRLPLNLKPNHLAGGFYTLRLSDGKHTRERGILITNQP